MVRTLGYKYLKIIHGFSCHKVPAESADMRWTYVIDDANDVYSSGSEIELSGRSWIQMIIHRTSILAANKVWMHFFYNC